MARSLKFALAITLLGAFLFVKPAHAGADDFYFSSFHGDYYLTRAEDGTSRLNVVEQLVAELPDFDQNHGITRIIPVTNQNGENFTMRDGELYVEAHRNNAPEPIANTERKQGYYKIYLGDAGSYVRGTQYYQLAYNFINVITAFDHPEQGRYQELYWDTNGTGWPQHFDRLSATIHLDSATAPTFTGEAWCYTGSQGSTASDCDISVSDDRSTINFTAKNSIAPYHNLTMALKFTPDSFVVPEPKHNFIPFTISVLTIGVSLIAAICAVFILRPKAICLAKKFYFHAFIPPQYIPPEDLTVAASNAALIDSNKNLSITAQVIEMAVKHKLDIIQSDKKGLFSKITYAIRIKNVSSLTEDERAALQVIKGEPAFVDSEEIPITNTYSHSRASAKTSYDKLLKHTLTSGGFYTKSSSANTISIVLTVVYCTLALIGFIAIASYREYTLGARAMYMDMPVLIAFSLSIILAVIALVTTSIASYKYSRVTERGFQLNNYLKGLKQYMQLAEADRIKFLQSPKTAEKINTDDHRQMVKLYEKLLPYAVMFRIEKQWAKTLELYYDTSPPSWYTGTATFSAANFASSMSDMSSSISSSISSSSSSGSDGGGSSGGGGGGGGGGGW